MSEDLDDAERADLAEAITSGRPIALDEVAVAAMREHVEGVGPMPVGFVLTVLAGASAAVFGGLLVVGVLALLLMG